MEYTIPNYYKDFKCIADKCPATCCAGWEIVIDSRTRQAYRNYPGEFGRCLRSSIDWKQGIFKQHRTRCAFLNERNLCDIYAEAGREMLCRTCRRYPRHYEEFENLREISLSVSCPEAAGMLLAMLEPVSFQTFSQEKEEETYEEFDFLLFTKLQDARECMFELAQNRSMPLYLRMALILALAHDLQRRIFRKRLYEVDELLERYQNMCRNAGREELAERLLKTLDKTENTAAADSVQRKTMRKGELRHRMFRVMYRMETLDKRWRSGLKKWDRLMPDSGSMIAAYREQNPDWEVQGEQLLVYFLFTYFCGAVYDEEALGKAKAAVIHTLLLEDIFAADMALNGSCYDRKRQESCLYRYAREIEHSERNLRRMEEYMNHDKLFSVEHILCVLL